LFCLWLVPYEVASVGNAASIIAHVGGTSTTLLMSKRPKCYQLQVISSLPGALSCFIHDKRRLPRACPSGSAMLQELSHMDRITQLQDEIQRFLTIMSSTIAYLTARSTFLQVSEEIPITKTRNPDKYDPPELFEANKKELVQDLIVKAKQIEYLIQSLPVPEPEEEQANRLQALEQEMQDANEEYIQAVDRAKHLHQQISEFLRTMLDNADGPSSLKVAV
ncbi:hypothetical protein AZE42_07723, partial [Rhizopogon vesiculosus]